jgi:hypothetical protein
MGEIICEFQIDGIDAFAQPPLLCLIGFICLLLDKLQSFTG